MIARLRRKAEYFEVGSRNAEVGKRTKHGVGAESMAQRAAMDRSWDAWRRGGWETNED